MRLHPNDCPCSRCEGIRRYPDPSLCDWCHSTHTGDANNCENEPEDSDTFSSSLTKDTLEDEQLMWATLGAIRDITKRVKENIMIPRSTAGVQTGSQRSDRGQAVRTGLPYLNQKNMHDYLELEVKYPVRLIDCRVNQNATASQSPVVLKIAIKGKTVLWGLRTNNPSLELLTEMFGDDENNWAEKTFLMWLHEDEFDGRIWPTVGPAEGTGEGNTAKPGKKQR